MQIEKITYPGEDKWDFIIKHISRPYAGNGTVLPLWPFYNTDNPLHPYQGRKMEISGQFQRQNLNNFEADIWLRMILTFSNGSIQSIQEVSHTSIPKNDIFTWNYYESFLIPN